MPAICRAYRPATDSWIEIEVPTWIITSGTLNHPEVPMGGINWVSRTLRFEFIPVDFRWEDKTPFGLLPSGEIPPITSGSPLF